MKLKWKVLLPYIINYIKRYATKETQYIRRNSDLERNADWVKSVQGISEFEWLWESEERKSVIECDANSPTRKERNKLERERERVEIRFLQYPYIQGQIK